MGTGYTECVATGEVTDFSEYMKRCLRAFGAFAEFRDDALTSDLPEYKVPTYHEEQLVKAENDLAKYLNPSTNRKAIFRKKIKLAKDNCIEQIERENLELLRYENMLKRARDWKANFGYGPLENLGKFLVGQLESSIERTNDYYEKELLRLNQLTFEEWDEKHLQSLYDDIEYHKKHHNEDVKRHQENMEWVNKVLDTLK